MYDSEQRYLKISFMRLFRMLLPIVLGCLLGFCVFNEAKAQDRIGVNLLSFHSKEYVAWAENDNGVYKVIKTEPYNVVTPGAYVQYESGLLLGVLMSNSLGKPGAYVGWTFRTRDDRWGLTLGAIGPYERRIMPLLQATFAVKLRQDLGLNVAEDYTLRVGFMPGFRHKLTWTDKHTVRSPNVVTVSIDRKF